LREAVKALNADAWWQNQEFSIARRTDGAVTFTAAEQTLELSDTAIPLNNVATALAVLKHAGFIVSDATMQQAVANTQLPGRRQLIASQPATYLDVGHNPQATESLAEWLDSKTFEQLHIVVAMLNDKAPAASLAPFKRFAPQWYLASTHGPRGLSAEKLAAAVENTPNCLFPAVTEAYEAARQDAYSEDLILVVGSFHTVADILALPHNTQNS
ncbi:MAG TPA: hypothetical protein DEP76_12470, partial [Alteromonas sp.]|nr:hypothetical protein [Alteromonas sp.]